jgi:hypothetical protein
MRHAVNAVNAVNLKRRNFAGGVTERHQNPRNFWNEKPEVNAPCHAKTHPHLSALTVE